MELWFNISTGVRVVKSKRNKTIDFSLADAPADVMAKIIQSKKEEPFSLDQVTDKVINGDSFRVMDCQHRF